MLLYTFDMDTATHFNQRDPALAFGDAPPSRLGPACDAVLGKWAGVRFDTADVAGWSSAQAEAGLAALEQVRRSLAAVTSALVHQFDAGRDTAAAITRATGSPQRSRAK